MARSPTGTAGKVSSPEFTPQYRVKDLGHSAKSAGGRLQLDKQTSMTQRSRSGLTNILSRRSMGTHQGNELTRNSSGNARPQSSQLAEPIETDPRPTRVDKPCARRSQRNKK